MSFGISVAGNSRGFRISHVASSFVTMSETVCNPSPLAMVRATNPAMMLPPPSRA
jgi:hypothetical protein